VIENVEFSMVDMPFAMVDGQWSMDDGRFVFLAEFF